MYSHIGDNRRWFDVDLENITCMRCRKIPILRWGNTCRESVCVCVFPIKIQINPAALCDNRKSSVGTYICIKRQAPRPPMLFHLTAYGPGRSELEILTLISSLSAWYYTIIRVPTGVNRLHTFLRNGLDWFFVQMFVFSIFVSLLHDHRRSLGWVSSRGAISSEVPRHHLCISWTLFARTIRISVEI